MVDRLLRAAPPAVDDDTIRFGLPLWPKGDPPQVRLSRERPWLALVAAIQRRLSESPCFVAFSGGCDSSLVLAAATTACREAGHPDPIAVTYRYQRETTDEAYQLPVIQWLGIRNWVRLDLSDADLLGPPTLRELHRTGLVWPPTLLTRAEALRSLGPGLFLTGDGGDEVLGQRRATFPAEVVRRVRSRRTPSARVVGYAVEALAPRRVAIEIGRHDPRHAHMGQWLEPALRKSLRTRSAELAAEEPLRPSRWPSYYLSRPIVHNGYASVGSFMAKLGMRWEYPLATKRFLGSIAGSTPWYAYRQRTFLLQRHFEGFVPDEILLRRTKARFNDAMFGPRVRAFAGRWTGAGLPDGVSEAWLREHWASAPMVHAGTGLLLHATWLADNPRP